MVCSQQNEKLSSDLNNLSTNALIRPVAFFSDSTNTNTQLMFTYVQNNTW